VEEKDKQKDLEKVEASNISLRFYLSMRGPSEGDEVMCVSEFVF